ncbi:hypothetical protein Pan161_60540 [Gimesia algae]|uniref:Uncharacterized protein n=1 Tax=Gimesia algae TaxID=2527971 RepID=A0A517VMV8_9PLAN|nr:hypothetical protein Pan161_60540 [Gimesia algae]
MIRPIAPTHKAATARADRIKQAEQQLKAAEKHALKENLAYGAIFLIVCTGCILLGKFISVIVRQM